VGMGVTVPVRVRMPAMRVVVAVRMVLPLRMTVRHYPPSSIDAVPLQP
jgi:hypothetical protein